MAQARKWSNVAVAMESALGTALTVSAITQANPGVASSTAHGLANGEIVKLNVVGMDILNGSAVRVAGVAADTFQLEGVDTTTFEDFVSGTAREVTLGTSIVTATEVTGSGGEDNPIPTTTIHDSIEQEIPGTPTALAYSMTHIWDAADPGLLAARAAYLANQERVFRFRFGTGGPIMLFNGYVSAVLAPGGQAQGLVTTPMTIRVKGTPTYYAS